MAVYGAYAVAPYTGDLKNGDFSIYSTTGVAVCGAYAVALYTGDLKNGDFSIRSTTGVAVYGAYAVAPLHGYPKKWRFFYPFDHRRGRLWGVCCCALHGQTKTGLVFGSYFEGGAEKGAGRGLCEKWGRRASIIIRRLLPLRARRRMGPIIASAHAFIIPNYVA